ncbi:MAG TPA: prolyl oligopeptidase family serine peptidase [Dehalococcoidia bacterium]|nr:prolyl oligopeptidase family serine peptidase [Dehalococcoidia bacterium]
MELVCELPRGGLPGLQQHYLVFLPAGYETGAGAAWPLMLSLHGAGERGDDPGLVKLHGIPKRLTDGTELPFIVVAPQCPLEQDWSPQSLGLLLDEVERNYSIDPDRVYVTGLSMGGRGTWALAIASPHRFAAIAPVCGRGDPDAVGSIAHVPVWAFHGALDPVVPPARSEEMVEALRRCGGNVRFTVYPEAGHDSWTSAYAEPELYAWLLSHRRV